MASRRFYSIYLNLEKKYWWLRDFLRNKVSKIFVITAGQKIGLFYSNIVRIKKEEAEGCGFMYIIHSIFNNTSAPIGAKVAD